MKITKMASVPLIMQDPFISIWSSFNELYEGDTTHWCGDKQRLVGYLCLNGKPYCFLGQRRVCHNMKQTGVELTATTSAYYFEAEGVNLKVEFCSPLLLEDPILVSRPCTYVDFEISGDYEGKNPEVVFEVSTDIVAHTEGLIMGGSYVFPEYRYAYMGKAKQAPLCESGDHMTIDWGYCYLASGQESAQITYQSEREKILSAKFDMTAQNTANLIFAFDDLNSIQYFESSVRGYWTKKYATILDAIKAAIAEHDELKAKCAAFDAQMEQDAREAGGEEYVLLCNAAYRHAIAAHKIIEDRDGNLIFLSKENDSNGCIGTVDVSYPSIPLFLLHNTEYVKGMMRPIFRFASLPVWEYDFAPHDVGRYPHATGQVYGVNWKAHEGEFSHAQGINAPYLYMFPAGTNCYDFKYQMPVEESGNMLIMAQAVTMLDGNTDFIADKMEVMGTWVNYLLENGMDPGEQLCTDDFAGHLAHNTNLSVKAILGVEAYALMNRALGNEEIYAEYHSKAQAMARNWEKTADAGDHTRLTFDREDTWSLKYNLYWDRFFGSNLFSPELFEKETQYYIKMQNEFGVPLDSRDTYTKSDWILWCTSLTDDKEVRKRLIHPINHYLTNTITRIPFGDWYDTVSSKYCFFIARSVQGGIYAPILMDKKKA